MTDTTEKAARLLADGVATGRYSMPANINDVFQDLLTLAIEVRSQAAEIARLRRRLECDRVYTLVDGKPVEQPADLGEDSDGIACRDMTIKLQDEAIARRDAEIARLTAALDSVATIIKPLEEGTPNVDPVDACIQMHNIAMAALSHPRLGDSEQSKQEGEG